MPTVQLPVRFYGSHDHAIPIETESTAFMLVDCDAGAEEAILNHIAPSLEAARRQSMRVLYFHEDAYGIGGPRDMTRELVGTRMGTGLPQELLERPQWQSVRPAYHPSIAPLEGEPDFPKDSKDGFQTTNADYYLRSWSIDTIIAVGFALRSCLYHTCMGARHRNYRVIMLRDCTTPPGAGEFPDTLDPANPEGGWMRFAFIRQFETNIGYTSTSAEFIRAVERAI